MLGKRRYLRVKCHSSIRWKIEGINIEGKGLITNYSVSGLQLIMDHFIGASPERCVLSIEYLDNSQFFKSNKIHIKWVKKIDYEGRECFHCGGSFI